MNLDALQPAILGPGFLAGLIVLATHVPLGREVLRRGIIFIDGGFAILQPQIDRLHSRVVRLTLYQNRSMAGEFVPVTTFKRQFCQNEA